MDVGDAEPRRFKCVCSVTFNFKFWHLHNPGSLVFHLVRVLAAGAFCLRNAFVAAARMTSTGADCPVHNSNARAP